MFKYQHILEAMAERAKVSETPWDIVQCQHVNDAKWLQQQLMPTFIDMFNYRIKPKTININGHEVPEPLRVKPNRGESYYHPWLCTSDFFAEDIFTDDLHDNRVFDRLLMHKTKEAAIAHAKALLSFTEQKND